MTDPLATIQLLARMFPAAFFVLEQRRRPLKIGIHADLTARLEASIPEVELSAALRVYRKRPVFGGKRSPHSANRAPIQKGPRCLGSRLN